MSKEEKVITIFILGVIMGVLLGAFLGYDWGVNHERRLQSFEAMQH